MRTPRIPNDVIIARFEQGLTDSDIARGYPEADAAYVFSRRMVLKLRRQRGRKPSNPMARTTRHGSHGIIRTKNFTMPAIDHPAFSESRTIFPTTVVDVDGLNNVLISGFNSKKIGGVIRKGPAKGFPIYTLTLEERATCPTSCRHWRSCFGNHMHLAKRINNTAEFEARLEAELAILQSRHPGGFAVRLHVLGDFYSVEYVNLWERFIHRFRSLMVFGFSARWERSDPIAVALIDLVMREWGRFSIRFSNAPIDECSTVSIDHPIQKPADAILCPAQTGRSADCGTCALCWNSRKRIAFLIH